jgi:hypothetical protein
MESTWSFSSRVAGVMVSIAAFQAVDPGSIPGPRIFFVVFFSRSTNMEETFVNENLGSTQATWFSMFFRIRPYQP